LDTAGTGVSGGVVGSHSEVTLLTPGSTPRVLDDPVVLAVLRAVANSEDTVIKRGSAAEETATLHDTTVIKLEHDTSGIDGNRDGSLVKGSLHGGTRAGGDILVGDNLGDLLGLFGVASSISTSVSIVGLFFETIMHGILESIVHKTTIATLIALGSGAVNKLLLRKGNEVASLDLPSTLHGTGGRESPAGTALSLVLDRGDGTLGSPVDRGGIVDSIKVVASERTWGKVLTILDGVASRWHSGGNAPGAG